jgi:hypothetical protein
VAAATHGTAHQPITPQVASTFREPAMSPLPPPPLHAAAERSSLFMSHEFRASTSAPLHPLLARLQSVIRAHRTALLVCASPFGRPCITCP